MGRVCVCRGKRWIFGFETRMQREAMGVIAVGRRTRLLI